MRSAAATAICLLLAACAGERPAFKTEITQAPLIAKPAVSSFGHCSGHGCEYLQEVRLDSGEWAGIRRLFEPAATSAAQERRQVAEAVARFEDLIGTRTGTNKDLGGTWPGFMLSGQLDCVDETVNTQTLLRLLIADGLLKWHAIAEPAGRGSFLDGLPHRTAVLTELESRTDYAIDSWFHDNGRRPEVVRLALWLEGWKPDAD